MILPSTKTAFPCERALQYRITSTILPKVALITAPMPTDDCALIDATAMPMKYARGMTEARHRGKITCGWTSGDLWSVSGATTNARNRTRNTTDSKLKMMMLMPSYVYL